MYGCTHGSTYRVARTVSNQSDTDISVAQALCSNPKNIHVDITVYRYVGHIESFWNKSLRKAIDENVI